MKGVILCGGESSRMGTDKGMLQLNGLNWVQTIATLFADLKLPFFVSVNYYQKIDYERLFTEEQLITDNKALNAKEPLSGLLSLHKALPNEDLLVIACDMIDMKPPPPQLLLDNYNSHNNFDAYLFKTNDILQPLCTIYTANLLNKTLNRLLNGGLNKFGLTSLLNETNNHITEAPAEWLHYFNNYNSQQDLACLNK